MWIVIKYDDGCLCHYTQEHPLKSCTARSPICCTHFLKRNHKVRRFHQKLSNACPEPVKWILHVGPPNAVLSLRVLSHPLVLFPKFLVAQAPSLHSTPQRTAVVLRSRCKRDTRNNSENKTCLQFLCSLPSSKLDRGVCQGFRGTGTYPVYGIKTSTHSAVGAGIGSLFWDLLPTSPCLNNRKEHGDMIGTKIGQSENRNGLFPVYEKGALNCWERSQ